MRGSRRLLRRGQSAKRRRLSGAVYAEAVLVMGTMILLLFLIEFVHDGFAKAAVAGTQTREHGWAHVMEPCDNDPPAPTQIEDEGSYSAGSFASIAFLAIDAFRLLSYQPLIAEYLSLLTYNIDEYRYSQVASLERTAAIGGTARYGHQLVLTCDEDLDSMEFGGIKFGLWTFAAYYLW
ncbi:MAG: hypothetical protein JJ863_19340 [Deltaproteobacteria bacterium]|nr:hypothetical protein [Deltaproteobacteria bacterium]